ncbi:hypothetical protein RB598_009039 [Gaeumannomyces tritici]
MAFPDFSNIPLPPAYIEKIVGSQGHKLYYNRVTKVESPLHPGKLRALQDLGVVPSPEHELPDFIRDVDGSDPDAFWAAVKAAAKDGRPCRETAFPVWGDSSKHARAEYTSYGIEPPWRLRETTVPPAGSAHQPTEYIVDYRSGDIYNFETTPPSKPPSDNRAGSDPAPRPPPSDKPAGSDPAPRPPPSDNRARTGPPPPPPYSPAAFMAGPGHEAPCERYSNLDLDELASDTGLCLGSPVAIRECGCGFCAEIMGQLGKCRQRWLHKQPCTDPSASQQESVVLRAAFWKKELTALRVEYQTRISDLSGSYHKCETKLPICSWKGSSMEPHIASSAPRMSDPGSPEQLRIALAWIDICTQEHENCRLPSLSHGFFPSRLLDLSDPDLLRLVEPSTMNFQAESYIALSYCWGQPAQEATYVTTPDNLAQRRLGFSERELPLTVRDAAATTRGLKVRYLWVDALCIMQGPSPEARADWEAESGRMGDVYKGAYLTLVAAAAASVHEGIFHSSQCNRFSYTEVVLRSVLRPEFNGAVRLGRYQEYPPVLKGTPLYHRGWALQERVLSRRLLVYSSDRVMWECQQMRQSDAGRSIREVETIRLPVGEAARSTTAEDLHECWHTLVEDFCKREISVESDKLPAIAGLARAFHRIAGVSGDEYLAGLWRSNLVPDLFWATKPVSKYDEKYDEKVIKTGIPERYRAPSWSWAAVDGGLHEHYLVDQGDEYVITVLRYRVTPRGPDPFGEVSNGTLMVQGKLLDMYDFEYWHFQDTDKNQRRKRPTTTCCTRDDVDIDPDLDPNTELKLSIFFDGDSSRHLPGDFMILGGYRFLRMTAYVFMVLRRCPERDGKRRLAYKRFGLARADWWPDSHEGWDRLFEKYSYNDIIYIV